MPDCSFYAKARAGFPLLVARWRASANATDERASIVLNDTALLMTYASSETALCSPEQLVAWSKPNAQPPLWLIKAMLFLLVQMPARPCPQGENESAAWVYGWLRLRHHDTAEAAQAQLPAHLQATLSPLIATGWADIATQRLA